MLSKLADPNRYNENEEEADEYTPYKLFTDKAADHISRLRAKLENKIEAIIEKKLLEVYVQIASQKNRLEEYAANEVNQELNQYLFNLKSDLEKSIALLSVNQQYVGMLSKTHQDMRKDCLLRLRCRSEDSERWGKKYNAEQPDESDQIKVGYPDEEEDAAVPQEEKKEQEENNEIDLVGDETQFPGFTNKDVYLGLKSKKIDEKFYNYAESTLVLDSKKRETYQNLTNFYINHHENATAMRKNLNFASNEYIERIIFALLVNSPLDKFIFQQFVAIFTSLSANPLNEIRIIDMMTSLTSIDPEDEATLKAFNEYFGSQYAKAELSKKLNSFFDAIVMLFEEYLLLTVEGKNVIENNNFDTLVAATEAICGVTPFKLRIKIYASIVTPKNVYSYIARKMIESKDVNKRLVEKAVKAILKVELVNLNPYHKDPVEASQAVQAAIECLITMDKSSKLRVSLQNTIANCLENDQIFFNCLGLLYQNYRSDIESANQELINFIASLKLTLSGAESDGAKKVIENISKNRDLAKLQAVLELFAKQSENIVQSVKDVKDHFTQHQESLCSNLKTLTTNLLEDNGCKYMYSYSIQIFELLEAIKKLSQRQSGVSLTLNRRLT